MALIDTNYASIGLVSTTASATGAWSSEGDQGFSEVLATQMQDDTSQAVSGASSASSADADLALTSYSAGQQVANTAAATTESTSTSEDSGTAAEEGAATTTSTDATTTASETTGTTTTTGAETTASAEETGETGTEETSAEETSETASIEGWPEGVGSEWTPSNMQFFDELTGQWVDDNIPHRLNADGKLEYCWEGEWYLDTAVKHRVATGEETQVAEGETGAEGEAVDPTLTYSLEGEGPFTADEYYNTAMDEWSLFNLPYRENEDGSREYYWGDQWWQDSMEHRAAA